MDRARVIAPSVSFAAHVAGAALLTLGLLVLPDRLPAPTRGGLAGLAVPHSLAVSLGGGAASARPRVGAPRVARVVAPVAAPTLGEALLPPPASLALAGGAGGAGLPDGPGGAGVGLCLASCGSGAREGVGDAVLPALQPRAEPLRVRVGGDVREPRKVRHVAPEYPQLALASRVQGSVLLDCVLDEDGRISSVRVLKSHPLLEAAAVEAVRQWRYRPTLLNGVRVSVLLTVTVDFRLR